MINIIIFKKLSLKKWIQLTIQERQRCSKIDQHIFQQDRFSLQQMNSMPKPNHNSNNEWAENTFQGNPDFSESTVLVNC